MTWFTLSGCNEGLVSAITADTLYGLLRRAGPSDAGSTVLGRVQIFWSRSEHCLMKMKRWLLCIAGTWSDLILQVFPLPARLGLFYSVMWFPERRFGFWDDALRTLSALILILLLLSGLFAPAGVGITAFFHRNLTVGHYESFPLSGMVQVGALRYT